DEDNEATCSSLCKNLGGSFNASANRKSADVRSKHARLNDDEDDEEDDVELATNGINKPSTTQTEEHKTAQEFVKGVLDELGYPSFAAKKYLKLLTDNYLTTMKQLEEMDRKDWRRLGYSDEIIDKLVDKIKSETNSKAFKQPKPKVDNALLSTKEKQSTDNTFNHNKENNITINVANTNNKHNHKNDLDISNKNTDANDSLSEFDDF
ncbi:hypothetical protein RFI_00981, partial [Reticulomyxa filosa]